MNPKSFIWAARNEELTTLPPRDGGELVVHEPDVLKVESNRIYFYSDISRETILKLNAKIRDLGASYVAEQLYRDLEVPVPIYLHINSYGGNVFHGLSAMDSVLTSLTPVYSVVDGCCASAATFMAVAAKKRLMQANAYMMIHQLSSTYWGKFTEFQDQMENLNAFMDKIKDIYAKYTKVPPEVLEELLKHDLWWDADQCLKYGLVDEIVQRRV